eukprot:scaffold8778_cov64-Attheya_sp.AAC.1
MSLPIHCHKNKKQLPEFLTAPSKSKSRRGRRKRVRRSREMSPSATIASMDIDSTPEYAQPPIPLPEEDNLWDTTPSPTINDETELVSDFTILFRENERTLNEQHKGNLKTTGLSVMTSLIVMEVKTGGILNR